MDLQRVLVIGSPGAGKSTFSRKLRDITGLPLCYLDMMFHNPDRTTASRAEFDEKLSAVLESDRWIIDGNYQRTLPARFERCTHVFFFDLPVEQCLQGAASRVGKAREDMPWIETDFDPEFRQYILDFQKDQLPLIYELIDKYKDSAAVTIFHSRKEADDWMDKMIKEMKRPEIINMIYNSFSEDARLEKSRQGQLEYLVTMNYIHRFLKPGDRVLEIGAGTGRYSIALAREGYEVTAVELVESNLSVLKENARGLDNIEAFQGDALDLGRFSDDCFDVTLSFGPMYHLYEAEDQHRALDEAIRVTKPGGIILAAFLSAHAIICTNYLYDGISTVRGLEENFDSEYNVRHFKEQLFTGFDIAEFEELFTGKDADHIMTVAVDNVLEVAEKRPDFSMTDEEFRAFADYQLHICEKREMLGNSSHLLYICKKR